MSGHMSHASIFGGWGHYANLLGAAFLVFFAAKSLGLFKRSAGCFVWLGRLGRYIRLALAAVVGLVSARRAEIIRRPCVAMREPGNITPLNSFCAGLGLSVSCLTCMGGAILYPLLIFVGTSAWYFGALILGTYSLALAVPMAAIAHLRRRFHLEVCASPMADARPAMDQRGRDALRRRTDRL